MVSSRVADVSVDIVYNVLTDDDDGSSVNNPITETLFGSIQALQPKDIQRLQEGGVEIRDGVSLLVSKAQERCPDKIIANNKQWRVVKWSFVYEYEELLGTGNISRGTGVALCDEILTGSAE